MKLNYVALLLGVLGVVWQETAKAEALTPATQPSLNRSTISLHHSESHEVAGTRSLEHSAPEASNRQTTLSPDIPESFIEVMAVDVLGSTIFSEGELQDVVAPFVGQSLTFEQMLDIRKAITDLYTENGYLTSGAYLPPQEVTAGRIQIQVIEGNLEAVEIQGLKRVKPSYVRQRLNVPSPLNVDQLEQQLQVLKNNDLFESVQAELQTGNSAYQSRLALTIQETFPLELQVSVDNYESPSVGEFGGDVTVVHNNVLGVGDRAHVSLGYALGNLHLDAGYRIPVTPKDTTIQLGYRRSTNQIVENPFADLDIRSRDETFSAEIRHPVIQAPTEELGIALGFDLRRSQSFLFEDRPFSFSEGAQEGRSRVSVLRLSQDWTQRSPKRVLAARSQFSLGLDTLDATINATGADGQFVSWLGQLQWVQNLGDDVLLVSRVGAQLTPDSLLNLEQFAIGGVNTVRGYRQNQQVGDNGIASSFEVRVPVVRDSKTWGNVQLVPFADIGHTWNNNNRPNPSPSMLASLGLGLRWQWSSDWALNVDWGLPLTSVNDGGNSLQDSGFNVALQFQPF